MVLIIINLISVAISVQMYQFETIVYHHHACVAHRGLLLLSPPRVLRVALGHRACGSAVPVCSRCY